MRRGGGNEARRGGRYEPIRALRSPPVGPTFRLGETETETATETRPWRRTRRRIGAAVALGLFAVVSSCRAELPPIRQRGAWIVVENQTRQNWRDVSVTVNSYYRGSSPALAAGGRLEAPLANFVTGLGQRFNTVREHIARVEVRATDAAGNAVALDWDEKTGPPLVNEAAETR